MKRLDINHLGKKYLEKYPKITIKSLFKEIEDQMKKELLELKLNWLELVYTKANLWWYRRWFKCPFCNHKAFTLYNVRWEFKCRKCLNLPYKSQKFSWMLEEKVYKNK